MTYPAFNVGDDFTSSDANAIGLWRITNCTVTSVGGTAATASNGVITVGSGNTSLTISNAFSALFDNYKIVYLGGSSSQNTNLEMQLGTTNTGYRSVVVFGAWSDTPAATAAGQDNGAWFEFVGGADPDGNYINIDVFGPHDAVRTSIAGPYIGLDGDRVGGYTTGFVANTTSYTAFTIRPNVGSLTGGTIRVYGYRD